MRASVLRRHLYGGRPRAWGRRACLLLALLLPAAYGSVRFEDETATAGIDHVYGGPWEFFVGGGVAAFDCDDDGLPDLFFAGGEGGSALFRNVSRPADKLRFERLTRPEAELTDVTGAYPLDVDGDGLVDLAVLRVGENVLLRGRGDCRFERANEAWGFEGGHAWSTAFAAVWEGAQAWPSLFVGNYVDRERPGAPWGTCHDNEFHRPSAGFYGEPVPLTPGYCALSLRVSDWDRDGVPDLWVSNDRQYYLGGPNRSGTEQLWRLEPEAPPYRYTEEDGWPRLQIWGMGIASADITGDGLPEFFLTSMTDNRLRVLARGASGPRYEDGAYERGITAHRPFTGGDLRPSTGWHAQFEDVDHDTLFDLFIAKGNVEAMPEFAQEDPNNLFLGQLDGSFREVAEEAGVLSFLRARGALLVDLNADGRLDLVVVNREAPAQLWRNVSTGLGHWLMLRLRQEGGNRAGIGAWLEVEAGARLVRRELYVGGGHVSGHWGWTHIGLGAAERVTVRVQWPDGEWQEWQGVPAGSFTELERGSPVALSSPSPRPGR